jgi:addiction module HigA family antidote
MLRRITTRLGRTMRRRIKQMHPGRVLREEYMEPLRLDTHGLATALGVTERRLRPIIADQGPVTSDLALRLAKCFRTSPQFWLGLQTAYDLGVAEARYGAEIDANVQALGA